MRHLALVASALALGAGSAHAGTYAGSKAEAEAKGKGERTLSELELDLDGDGKDEIAVVSQVKGGMRAQILRLVGERGDEDRAFDVLATGQASGAKRLVRAEPKRICGRTPPELLLVFEDPSPDETVTQLLIFSATSAGVRAVFSQSFVVPKDAPPPDDEVRYGDATPHYALVDLDGGEGDLEVVWVKDGQRLAVQGTRFVIGALRKVYRFDAKKESYTLDKDEEVVDFLPPHKVSEVAASAQVGKVWGTAQAFWAADEDLETSWNVEATQAAIGQALTVKWKDNLDLRMIRVVPGCGASPEAWDTHARIASFRLILSSGKKIEVDRRALAAQIPGARAVGEFPLEGGYGAQVLVMLGGAESVRWARLEIVDLDPSVAPPGKKGARPKARGKGPAEACLSEISFH